MSKRNVRPHDRIRTFFDVVVSARIGRSAARDDRAARLAVFAIMLVLVEVFIDAVTWIELDVAAIYGLPLLLAAITRSRRLLWFLTILLIIATFAVYAIQIPVGAFALRETFFVNRVFDAVAILLAAGLLHLWLASGDTIEAQAELLEERNDKLQAINAELSRRQEQIARQNEELDRRRAATEEESAHRMQLLAWASHDIRTPANTINVMAEVIRRTAENPALAAQLPRMTERLQANALSLVNLVSDVLDSAQLQLGHFEYNESIFPLNDLIADTCRNLLPVAQAKGLQLDAEIPERAIWVRTDLVKLRRVISNLIANAIKFTEEGGVTVSAARAAEGAVLIRVSDTGIGIASGQSDVIFKEFAQIRRSSDQSSGWGLGLAICRHLVNLMGGTIKVEGTLHEGSTFTVKLPPESLADERTVVLPSETTASMSLVTTARAPDGKDPPPVSTGRRQSRRMRHPQPLPRLGDLPLSQQ